MRIARFLETAREQILAEAVAFARTLPALAHADEQTLRNHLPLVLQAISADLRTEQSEAESIAKSHGLAPQPSQPSSAQIHGQMRAQSGIDIEQLVAEFRALRASVMRLWAASGPQGAHAAEDSLRFHEAIDQAVAESVQYFAREHKRWNDLFLGVLGHDLRGPLQAIGLVVERMRAQGSAPAQQTAVLARGVERMKVLLDSLLAYSRHELGMGLALQRTPVDLAVACAEEIELQRLAYPQAQIVFSSHGPLDGLFDASRVREALGNLVANAVKHGEAGSPIRISAQGTAGLVRMSVCNQGSLPADVDALFEPLQRGRTGSAADDAHLGLGLFIVRLIAKAHGGDVRASCDAGDVRFVLELPTG